MQPSYEPNLPGAMNPSAAPGAAFPIPGDRPFGPGGAGGPLDAGGPVGGPLGAMAVSGADPFPPGVSQFGGDCQAMIARLYHFLDGELTDVRRETIMAHLEQCPSCFSAYDFEAELRIVVRERTRTHVPASLIGRIKIAIETERNGC